jgi:putative sigma-54 modulation protein
MKIDFVARRVTLNDQVRQLAEKKLSKITKYFNDILDVRVELDQERHLYVADLAIKGKDFDVKSTSQNKDLTTAIQDAIDKAEIQARRAKTRLKNHKGRQPRVDSEWSMEVLEPDVETGGEPRIVQQRSIPIKPMSVEEAVLQLEESPDEFLVFRNSANDKINVLYRLPDKNLGLITPEL